MGARATRIEAGRRYAVVGSERGVRAEGLAVESPTGRFEIDGWFATPDGKLTALDEENWWVEEADDDAPSGEPITTRTDVLERVAASLEEIVRMMRRRGW